MNSLLVERKAGSMQKQSSVFLALSLLIVTANPASGQRVASQTPASNAGVESRAESLLRQMTLEEKIDLLGGVDGFFIRGLPRLGIPRLKMADGPIGVRNFGPATTMAGGIALAATWNPQLAEQAGAEIARDARAKGVHFLLGPGVNIYRAPMNGRNFEYFGEDPFLASRLAVAYIRGVQSQGVSATIKHFMGNNSEFDRHNTDSIIDERTMHEIYLPTFEAAVKEARVGAIMDSYNLVNGEHASQNHHLLTEIAKQEWGFDGLIMSDWSATYDGVAAANGGQDLEMPSGFYMNRKTLLPAIQDGRVSQATIDDKVRRILRTAIRFGWLDREQTDLSIPRFNPPGRQVALESARESMVLLKNDQNLLPVDKNKIKSIAIIGPGAYPAVPVGGGSARVEPFRAISFMEGLSNAAGPATNIYYHRGIPTVGEMAQATNFTTALTDGATGLLAEYFSTPDLKGTPSVTRIEQHINYGPGSIASFPEQTLSSRWTGYYSPQSAGDHTIFVLTTRDEIGGHRLFVDDKLVLDNWTSARSVAGYTKLTLDRRPHKIVLEQHGRSNRFGAWLRMGILAPGATAEAEAKQIAARADVVVVAVGFNPDTESEGADRTFGLPPGQNELIRELADANKHTVVVITSGGSVDMNAWLDHVPAILEVWYPGQEGGTALADVLFGSVNPSGRLPATFERRWEDNPTHDSYYPEPGTKRIVYKEGIFVGYRGYEHNQTKPLFPFGYGLSYTNFKYSNLAVHAVTDATSSGPRYEVSFDVQNTGKRAGAEVAQIYVHSKQANIPRPEKELKGFARVNLDQGQKRRVNVTLDERALSYYDVNTKQWRPEPGQYEILVGQSSAQIELRHTLTYAGSRLR
jgi:beta-glucosidase